MKSLCLCIAFLVLSMIGFSTSFAGALDDVRHSQARIDATNNKTQAAQERSDFLNANSEDFTVEVMYAWYDQAKKAGIAFDKVDIPLKSSDGLVTNKPIAWYANGAVTVYNSCVLTSCKKEADVVVHGSGPDGLSMYFDGPTQADVGRCNDGLAAESCICRFSAFGDFLSMPCKKVFDYKQRTKLKRELVESMNKALAASMKS